jgi:hypothetical protein
MKKSLFAAVLALIAFPTFAAIQYDFLQKSTMDDAAVPSTDLAGRAVLDGPRSRVDFLSGNTYPPGTFVVSKDGSRRLFFVDPLNKWYTEFNMDGAASAIGASSLKVENTKSSVQKLPDEMVIAGIRTEHYQVTITYDITLDVRAMSLKQNVKTIIDNWTTAQFGDLVHTAFASSARTGNAAIDDLLDAEMSKVHGFPMRQVVTVHSRIDLPQMNPQLKLPSTRTIVHETSVTAVRELNADPAIFNIPAGYRRADTPELPKTATATQTLQFDPPAPK